MPDTPPKLDYEREAPSDREPADWWVLIVMLGAVPFVVLLSYFFNVWGGAAAVLIVLTFLYVRSRQRD